jgi:hypothetical protein
VRKAKLLSTVAVALLLSAGAASAQGMNKDKPDRAPAAQQNAPAEKVAPSIKQGEHKSPATTGQATSESKSGKARETTGQAPKSEDHEKAMMDKDSKSAPAGGKSEIRSRSEQNEHGRNAKSGKASETTGQSKSEEHENSSMDKDDKSGAGKSEFRSRSEQNERGVNGRSSSQTTTEKDRATTGQGAASGAAKLSTEQRTKITSIIREHKVEPAHLNVSVRIGTRIPESVHLYALPVDVVTVYPEWRGYDYILVGDEVVVINPRTHEIVAILEA